MKYFIINDSALTKVVRPTFTIDNTGKTKRKHFRMAKITLKNEYRKIASELGITLYNLNDIRVVEIDEESYEDYIKDTEMIVSEFSKKRYKQNLIVNITSKLNSLSINELENILEEVK